MSGKYRVSGQPVKVDDTLTYREPNQLYSHPSPPYEGGCEPYNSSNAMYQNYAPAQHSQSHYQHAGANQGSPVYSSATHNGRPNHPQDGYHFVSNNPSTSPQAGFDTSPQQVMLDPLPLALDGSDSFNSMNHSGHRFVGMRQPPLGQNAMGQFGNSSVNPYSQVSLYWRGIAWQHFTQLQGQPNISHYSPILRRRVQRQATQLTRRISRKSLVFTRIQLTSDKLTTSTCPTVLTSHSSSMNWPVPSMTSGWYI